MGSSRHVEHELSIDATWYINRETVEKDIKLHMSRVANTRRSSGDIIQMLKRFSRPLRTLPPILELSSTPVHSLFRPFACDNDCPDILYINIYIYMYNNCLVE
ncbi:unnamed protein product [Ixodes persulcatus]